MLATKLSTKKLEARVARVAKSSGITVERWLLGVIETAVANDESHFAEIVDREAVEAAVDRGQFGRASNQLRNLRPGTVDELVRIVAAARMRGREEGATCRRGR
ncbi:MAG TPA: hypothetical protein VJN18_32465 [Polyangiaceae bacterium]|nr:hypothetical protein [Polyangiaceae bacterium]